jgi:antagonist of KipI
VANERLAHGYVALVRAGEEVVATAQHGRAWLAISGGINVPVVLNSRSTDSRGGFGGFAGRALHDGDRLQFGGTSERARKLMDGFAQQRISPWFAPNEWSNTTPHHPFLRVVEGADFRRFDRAARDALVLAPFAVLPESDRMGARLEGAALTRKTEEDLRSEAVAPGIVQVPPSGDPIVLLGDCQTIGGYPKIAHVITVDLAAAAQLQPGDLVRFVMINLDDAQRLLCERECDLQFFRTGLELRMR